MPDAVHGKRRGARGCVGVAGASAGCAIGCVVLLVLAGVLAWILGVSVGFDAPPRVAPAPASEPVFWRSPSVVEPVAWELHGKVDFGCLGASIAVLPDRDGDGWEDLAIGAFSAIDVFLPVGLGQAVDAPPGRVAIVSGATGAALHELEALFDGEARAEPRLVFGAAVAAVGDIDGDGTDDIAVAACESSPLMVLPRFVQRLFGAAQVFLVSGSTHELLGSVAVRRIGWIGLASLGERDGSVHWAILTNRLEPDERAAEAEVSFVAGMSVVERSKLEGGVAAHASPGDLDGDAATDLVVATSQGDENALVALSSRDGRELWRVRSAPVSLGGLVSLGDIDGDGVADLATALQREEASTARIELRSGADGHLLRGLSSELDGAPGALAVAALDDLDGDGRRELVVGHRGGIDVVWSDGWTRRAVSLPTPGPGGTMVPAARTLVVLAGPVGRQLIVWCEPSADAEGRVRGIVRAMPIERPR